MSDTKTPSELIAEIDYEISRLYSRHKELTKELYENENKCEQLILRKQSILNYLNEPID